MKLLSFVTISALAASTFAASAADWHSRSIYELVVDRFAQTDGSSPKCDTSDRVYCGGTWQGVINKLDYIQNLGFDAIWISPVVTQINGTTPYGEAFHGYWSGDITTLNSHFGPASDLKSLSDALHKRDMFLMVDVVINHMAATAVPPNLSFNSLTPFDNSTSFHPFCFISDYNNQTDVEQCWLGDTNVDLPDLDTEDQNIVDYMYSWIANLVKDNGIDGVRIDTVKHIRQDFWSGFNQSAGVFTIGEILHNDTNYVAPYTKVIDGALDYPTWYTLVQAFQTPFGNLSLLTETAQETQSRYQNGAFNTGSFLENHDQPRFQSLTTDQALVKNAMAWPFVTDGIPILYYGQEQGYAGGPDPANREALWLSGYNENNELVQHVQALNAARKAAASASSSFLSTAMKVVSVNGSTMAISKGPLLTLLTNGGNSSSPSWTVPNAGYSANEALTDVLTCSTFTADGNGGVTVSSTGGTPHVLLPSSALSGSGLCGNKASNGTTTTSGASIVKAPQVAVYGASLAFAGLLALTL